MRHIRPEWANQDATQRYGAIQGICTDSATPELSLSCSVLLAEQGSRVVSRVNTSAVLDSEASAALDFRSDALNDLLSSL
jgi:hypothetical protein